MAPLFAIIRYALLETFFCIPILPKTSGLKQRRNDSIIVSEMAHIWFQRDGNNVAQVTEIWRAQ